MEEKACFTIFLCLSACLTTFFPEVNAARRLLQDKLILNGPTKMFVFGDSYADTGNWPPTNASMPWTEPYGMTFPGKPSGRWSDGQVLPDYIASYLGIESPQAYGMWKGDGGETNEYGMNFAYGGTGVFDTEINGPNMTTQINYLQQLVEENVYTKHDLSWSVALVSSAGNDYLNYQGSPKHLLDFIESLTRNLSLNLKRIHEMGIPKVAVTAMEPTGCVPFFAASSGNFPNCDQNMNNITRYHNQLLKQEVDKLNDQADGSSPFVILDLYAAFMSAMNIQDDQPGESRFPVPLLPCCLGRCGGVDESGNKLYTLCDDPKMSFFWDLSHPTQEGWLAVYSALESSLHALWFDYKQATPIV